MDFTNDETMYRANVEELIEVLDSTEKAKVYLDNIGNTMFGLAPEIIDRLGINPMDWAKAIDAGIISVVTSSRNDVEVKEVKNIKDMSVPNDNRPDVNKGTVDGRGVTDGVKPEMPIGDDLDKASLKVYEVEVPVIGFVKQKVEATNPKEARKKAYKDAEDDSDRLYTNLNIYKGGTISAKVTHLPDHTLGGKPVPDTYTVESKEPAQASASDDTKSLLEGLL